jgi:UDP-glucose 4-epimerase
MPITATSGAVYIGSYIVGNLVGEKYDAEVIDNLSSGRLENLANAGITQESK